LRANRFVAAVLKPLRTTPSTRGLCAPRALRFIPQNEFLPELIFEALNFVHKKTAPKGAVFLFLKKRRFF
jgi:hypothetical protein